VPESPEESTLTTLLFGSVESTDDEETVLMSRFRCQIISTPSAVGQKRLALRGSIG
jgi:hypothetical protein